MSATETSEYQPQQRLALVCEDAPERQAVIKAVLEQLGLGMYAPRGAEEAVERLRRHFFELVLVNEQFNGATPLDNPVLEAVRTMAMSMRRYIFVVLVGREHKTFDNMMAFARSVNLVVNVNDLPHLAAILRKGVIENNEFYRVYREALAGAGRR
jgi:CheY-like chemotaxis protein